MDRSLASFLLALLITFSANASSLVADYENYLEMKRDSYLSYFQTGEKTKSLKAKDFDSKLYLDALYDEVTEGNLKADFKEAVSYVVNKATLSEMIFLHAIESYRKEPLSNLKNVMAQILSQLIDGSIETKAVYLLMNYRDDLYKYYRDGIYGILDISSREDIKTYKDSKKFYSKSPEEIQDLVFNTPNLSSFMNGKYEQGIRLFMFCRHNRNYHCQMIMKDRDDNLVLDDNGEFWMQPALAQSSRGIPYHSTNGYTPSGVHLMNSVMPEANAQRSFGKFRRVILNWVSKSKNENLTREVLPQSAQDKNWWKEAVVSRDVGRDLLRIHGTGKLNPSRSNTWYPFRRSSGCITKREGAYPEKTFIDQREILDTLMVNLGLTPNYKNEEKIKGILWVIELDDEKKHVDRETIKQYLGLN